MERFHRLLARYPVNSLAVERQAQIEIDNLQYYGYGVSGFVLSLIEAAIELTGGQVRGVDLQELIDLGKEMFTTHNELLSGTEQALAALATSFPLLLITKGDLRHQLHKLDQSGLKKFFRAVEVVSDKTPQTYAAILARHAIEPARFMMVGDSLRSDILPVLALGGWAVHIPAPGAWSHEGSSPIAPPDGARLFELEHIGRLPELLNQLVQGDS